MLTIGDTAPAWTAFDQEDKKRTSEECSGRRYLLYFYPKDDTPGCTAEACGFRDRSKDLLSKVSVLGVSADSAESHKKFASKYALPFPLLSDPDRTIISSYGADGQTFPKRTSFLIGPEGIIEKIYHGFDCAAHASDVLADVAVPNV